MACKAVWTNLRFSKRWISSSSPLLMSVRGMADSKLKPLKHEGIQVTITEKPQLKPDPKTLKFGHKFSDHMLLVDWNKEKGWNTPSIIPFGNLSLSPASSCFHYAIECFEGLKAYRDGDGKIRLFRPMMNMNRLNVSAVASSLPKFDGAEFLECIKDLLRIDKEWIPEEKDCSLYIRPTFIGADPFLGVNPSKRALLYCITSPVGPYFESGTFEPVKLYADPQFIRAWRGGVGDSKMGGNYGPTIRIQTIAQEKDCEQVLWLYGDDQQLTEVGTMNIFIHWINEDGVPEIATPPLLGNILPGVTRDSLIALAKEWKTHNVVERDVTMKQLKASIQEGRLKELFGAGTACVVCPIEKILYLDEHIPIPTMETGAEVARRLYKELTDIQYGRTEHEWSVIVD